MAIQIGCCTPTVAVFAANSTPKFLFSQNYSICSFKSKIPTLSQSSLKNCRKIHTQFISKASASSSAEIIEYVEPVTKVKFPSAIAIPGCSSSISFLAYGYREKVFATIGAKVYAAGLYVNQAMLNDLSSLKGKSGAEIEQDLSVFQSIYQSALEKALLIELVRDVNGKTFWDALNKAVSPRVAAPTPVDESALSNFRKIFEGRSLKKGTRILLTWLEPSKLLVSVSTAGVPAEVDATINSINVTKALFDAFFGESPVSPTLKTSVANGLSQIFRYAK